jgi:SNF2 family DNA or RNA helicase
MNAKRVWYLMGGDQDSDLVEAISGLTLGTKSEHHIQHQMKRTKMYEHDLIFKKKNAKDICDIKSPSFNDIHSQLLKGIIPTLSSPFVFREPSPTPKATTSDAKLEVKLGAPNIYAIEPPKPPPVINFAVFMPTPTPQAIPQTFSFLKPIVKGYQKAAPKTESPKPEATLKTEVAIPTLKPTTPDPNLFEPPNEFNICLKKPFKLYPHQIEAIRWALSREAGSFHGIQGGILALSVGLGKTIISLSTIMASYKPGDSATLIITPKSLMMNYLTDAGKFFGSSIRGYILDREIDDNRFFRFTKQEAYENHIIIMSVDTLTALGKSVGKVSKGKSNSNLQAVGEVIYSIPWVRVVCDESHRFSNHKTQLWEALKTLPRGKRLLLTGTVVRNYEDGLFAQLSVAGMTILENARHWTIQNFTEYKLREALYVKAQSETTISLPPTSIETVHVELSPFELQVYRVLQENSKKIYEGYKSKDGTIFANVLEQFTRMRQACIALYLITPQSKTKKLTDSEKERLKDGSILGPEYIDLERKIRQKEGAPGLESAKMLELIRIAKAIPPTEKMIVFSQWATCCALAATVLGNTFGSSSVICADGELDTIERDSAFQQFRLDGKTRFLCMTSIGSEGLTLTEANHMCICEPGFASFTNEQAIGRINRIGQTRPTFVYQLITNRSVEHRMLEILSKKLNVKEDLLNSGINTEVIDAIFGIEAPI